MSTGESHTIHHQKALLFPYINSNVFLEGYLVAGSLLTKTTGMHRVFRIHIMYYHPAVIGASEGIMACMDKGRSNHKAVQGGWHGW